MSMPPREQETRTILAISLPLMAAYMAEMGMVITDMIIVGRLGSNELAAVGLAGDWFYVLMLIGMGGSVSPSGRGGSGPAGGMTSVGGNIDYPEQNT